MIGQWRKQIRPYYFSPTVQKVVRRTNLLVSPLLFDRLAKERLRSMLCRLPSEFSTLALAHIDKIFRLCQEGRGLGPQAHFELSRWLSGKRWKLTCSAEPSTPMKKATKATSREGKLKILFVTGCFPSVRHGGGLRIFDLIHGLSKKHEVSLYSFYEGEDEETLQRLSPKLHSVRLVSQNPFSPEDFLNWIRQRTEERFDAIHFVWPETAILMPFARAFTNQMIFEFIESMTRKASLDLIRMFEGEANGTARPVYDLWRSFLLESLGSRLAHSTISLTSADEEFAEQLFPSGKGNLIPQCISDLEVWEKMVEGLPAPENHEALFLGFFQHTPNLEGLGWYLKEIHPRIKRAMKDYCLVVAGDGATDKVRALIGDDKAVRYQGRFTDLVSVISASRICVAPLISGSGIRGKVNQYSAVGRPTVTTTIGATGLPYVSDESIFIADSAGEFAERVIRLFRDKATYESMRLKAEKIARANFQTSAILPKLEALYAK